MFKDCIFIDYSCGTRKKCFVDGNYAFSLFEYSKVWQSLLVKAVQGLHMSESSRGGTSGDVLAQDFFQASCHF